jgi:hypothetical protein
MPFIVRTQVAASRMSPYRGVQTQAQGQTSLRKRGRVGKTAEPLDRLSLAALFIAKTLAFLLGSLLGQIVSTNYPSINLCKLISLLAIELASIRTGSCVTHHPLNLLHPTPPSVQHILGVRDPNIRAGLYPTSGKPIQIPKCHPRARVIRLPKMNILMRINLDIAFGPSPPSL